MTDFPKKSIDDWRELASKECKGRSPDELTWATPEGIAVKALYTAEDLEDIEHLDSLPGMAPFVRGPRATMYAGRPWTVRQYAGFSTAEESNAFYRKNLEAYRNSKLFEETWTQTKALFADKPQAWSLQERETV